MKKKNKIIFLLIASFFFIITINLSYALNETHLDKSKLPQGCTSCHKSHGKRATVMLELPKDALCFKCHGTNKRGIQGEAQSDIYSVILKRSNHPVTQTTQYHITGETLPERSSSKIRHASCYDCHNPHLLTSGKPLKGTRGYSGRGMKISKAENEYEVCYNCHSDSANLPSDASNIAGKFESGNASFHPVETPGKNRTVPSLKNVMSATSTITCSDCHGNDDKWGPKGPHGSNYDFILADNYIIESGPESPYAYELCYGCHRRASILNDDSFKAHKRHVVFGDVSCYACHDAHGSRDYDNLINFDPRIVTQNTLNELNYLKFIPGKPRCFLTCHVNSKTYEHKLTGDQYCINNTNCIPGW